MLKDRDVEIVKTVSSEPKIASPSTLSPDRPQDRPLTANRSSQSVIFQQSQIWSRAIGWGIMSLIVTVITWAALAHIDEAIPVKGKLEPIDDAKKIQAPMPGVIKQIYVKNGDRVAAGAVLLRLESTVSESQLTYLASTKDSLVAENSFYRAQMVGGGETSQRSRPDPQLKIAPEILALTTSRTALIAENQLYRAEIGGRSSVKLTPAQRSRLESNIDELNTRIAAGNSEIGQVRKQISENRVKRQGLVDRQAGIGSNIVSINHEITSGRLSLATSLSQIDRQLAQNRAKLTASQKNLVINQKMLAELRPAGAAGAVAATQIDRQEQEVISRTSDLEQQTQEQSRLQLEQQRLVSIDRAEIQKQQQRIQEQRQLLQQHQSEIGQLDQEDARLQLSVTQSAAKLANNRALNRKDLFTRIADNDKRIAEIDSQLNKSIVENAKKITEITNQIAQANQSLKYQEIRSPVAGAVFELKAYPAGVVGNNAEPLMQIIPTQDTIAKVYITNKDIGFVKIGQQVDVRIDTFNFSEFGDIKGTIEWIGSDALPPDQAYPFARFPAKIKLSQQTLIIKGVASQLKPGMSIEANIKLRDRTVMSLFTDTFFKQADGVKNLR
jgi:hemolysin D